MLAGHGEVDPLAPVADARARYQRAPYAEVWTVADGRHDVFNDITHRRHLLMLFRRVRAGLPLVRPAPRRRLGQ